MSIKRRFEAQYRRFSGYADTMVFPSWLDSVGVRIIIVGLVAILGIAYVLRTSSLATSGFVLHDLENKVAILEQENQKVDVAVAAASSIANIEKRLDGMDLMAVANVKFINFDGGMVAKK